MADFTEKHPDLFIEAAEEYGVDWAAQFGADINSIERMWNGLKELYLRDEPEEGFTAALKSLDKTTLGKLVLFGLYREHDHEEQHHG